jgi:hypothetical protein
MRGRLSPLPSRASWSASATTLSGSKNRFGPATCGDEFLRRWGMTVGVSLRAGVVARPRTSASKDVDLLVLCHEITALRRATSRSLDWAERVVFAALVRWLPKVLSGHPLAPQARSCAGTAT